MIDDPAASRGNEARCCDDRHWMTLKKRWDPFRGYRPAGRRCREDADSDHRQPDEATGRFLHDEKVFVDREMEDIIYRSAYPPSHDPRDDGGRRRPKHGLVDRGRSIAWSHSGIK